MTSHETLLENYEDALFALLMEHVAEIEGALLDEQNELLKQIPEAAIHEGLDKKCRRAITRGISKHRAKEAGRVIRKTISRTATIVFVSIILFVAAIVVVPGVRIRTLNFLLKFLMWRSA